MWNLPHSESKFERGRKHQKTMFFSSLLTSPTVDFNTEQGLITTKFETARIHFSHVCLVVVTKFLCEKVLAGTTQRQREISKKRKTFCKETTFSFFLYLDAVPKN